MDAFLFHIAIKCGQAFFLFGDTYYLEYNNKIYRWVDFDPKDYIDEVPFVGY